MLWRRSYDVPPPPLADDAELSQVGDPRYAALPPELVPRTECLKDVVARTLPYFESTIVPDLLAEAALGGAVLVVAHGNSLRALRKELDGLSDDDVVGLEIPTGIPYRYVLDADMQVLDGGYLGDAEAAARAAEAVGKQAG